MRWWLVGLLWGCSPEESTPLPALEAGFARSRLPVPVGIGTSGYGPFGAPVSPSPFSEIYPGTTHVFGHPEVKVVALSRGEGAEAIFVRLDSVGVFAQLRTEIVDAASERVGRDLDDALLIGATHTHSGPGRVLNTGTTESSFYDIIVDKFMPELYDRFVAEVADTIADAVADAQPARLGSVIARCPEGHNDRRCEDGETYTNDDTPVLAIERDGQVDLVVLAYPVHGTVMGLDDLHLSQDVSGAIETSIEDGFDHPVEVVMFNSWGADMSPADPAMPEREVSSRDGSYDRMWRVGASVAEDVHAALADVVWEDEPTLDLHTVRVPIDRERIGYDLGVFPFDYGGVYCGTDSGTCEDPVPLTGIDRSCIPLSEAYPAPQQVDVTVGQIGPFALTTFPGEPGTHLAEGILAGIAAAGHDGGAMFLGYTQDYLGYSILEEDWWYGGYEASGALWGPRQGEYLSRRIVEVWDGWSNDTIVTDLRGPLVPFPYSVDAPYQAAAPIDLGGVALDVPATLAASEPLVFAVRGGDPWLGAPVARLVAEGGAAATRPNGATTDSDDQNWDVALLVEPPWSEEATERTFTWTFRVSPRARIDGGLDVTGRHRVVVDVPEPGGSARQVESGVVDLTP